MGLLDIFFKKWTYDEKLAYLKAQINLLSVDGDEDDKEYKAVFENMKIIRWRPENESEFDQYMSDAQNMSINDGIRIIKNMSSDKKKIVSLGLKTMALADNKLVDSEVTFLNDFESKTGIPKVIFSKMELAKFKYTEKEKSVSNDRSSEKEKSVGNDSSSQKNQTKSSEFDSKYLTVDLVISALKEGGIAKDYKFVKLVFEKLKTGSVRNEEQLNSFILSFLRKQSRDEVISKIVNFQTMENILGSALIEYEENDDTNFNGYIELEQYHSVATRAYQLCQQVMFESIISGAK